MKDLLLRVLRGLESPQPLVRDPLSPDADRGGSPMGICWFRFHRSATEEVNH